MYLRKVTIKQIIILAPYITVSLVACFPIIQAIFAIAIGSILGTYNEPSSGGVCPSNISQFEQYLCAMGFMGFIVALLTVPIGIAILAVYTLLLGLFKMLSKI